MEIWLNIGIFGETRTILLNIRHGNMVKYRISWGDKNITSQYKAGNMVKYWISWGDKNITT